MPGAFLDLNSLENRLGDYYENWNAAIADGPTAARRARSRLMRTVWAELDQIDAATGSGLYLFAEPSCSNGVNGLRYIGSASNQTLSKRLKDYFRDDACLDAKVRDMETAAAEDYILSRLLATMSNPEPLRKYTQQHIRTRDLTKGGGLYLAQCNAAPELIKEAEGALVAISWGCGAPLRNREVSRLPFWRDPNGALRLALETVAAWFDAGLPPSAAELLTSKLQQMIDRSDTVAMS